MVYVMHHIDASLWTVCTVMAYALSDVDGNCLFHHKNRSGGLAWKMHIEEGAGFPSRVVTALHYPGISSRWKETTRREECQSQQQMYWI